MVLKRLMGSENIFYVISLLLDFLLVPPLKLLLDDKGYYIHDYHRSVRKLRSVNIECNSRHLYSLKDEGQISKEQCVEKYYSCDKAC